MSSRASDAKPPVKHQLKRWLRQAVHQLDTMATTLLQAEDQQVYRRHHSEAQPKGKLLTPEDEVRQLMTGAQSLDDLWRFFHRRLNGSADIDLMVFSVMDESGDYLRLKYLHPMHPGNPSVKPFDQPIVSMIDKTNHLVQSCARRDTTFTSRLSDLGRHITPYIHLGRPEGAPTHLFSVPFIAGDRTVALLTLGFSEVDAFSQAKLSYVYTLRDQIAQLVWNLALKDRMSLQAQYDPLTNLVTHSYFQQMLESELQKADERDVPLTVMILDINNIQQINQSHGHEAGDEAICHMASTVRRLIRGIDVVARYGGDEIVALLPETDPDTADTIAERFMAGLKDHLPKKLAPITASIGIATYPNDSKVRDNLLKFAEQALTLAKFKGGKTLESTKVAYREARRLNDKTVLEVFASHVAKKYDNHSIFKELQHIMEQNGGSSVVGSDETPSAELLMLETIGSLAGALDAKDKYTRGHSQAVANYAVALAHALQLPAEEVEEVRLAAFLHDIGKIGIPESILCKDGPLNEREWEIMKQHPVIGARQILAPVTSLKGVIPMVEHHHENWDGSGYPAGLSGEAIPLGARIVCIVDAFHGLTSDRSYRKALPIQKAAEIMQAGAGTKWDPHLIEVFIKILNIATPRRVAEQVTHTPGESSRPKVVAGQAASPQLPEKRKPAELDAEAQQALSFPDLETEASNTIKVQAG